MILGSPYERLVAVNGKPLPPEQQEREQQELETTLVERRKESGPTVQGRTSDEDLRALYIGRGYKPYFVEGDDPEVVHQLLAGTLDDCYAEIRAIQREARPERVQEATNLAHDRPAHAKRVDLSETSGWNPD